jgi:hypothetical protein
LSETRDEQAARTFFDKALDSNSNRQLISPIGVQLDEVYSSDIIGYTIKSMPSYAQDTARFIGVLGIDGTDRISPAKYK